MRNPSALLKAGVCAGIAAASLWAGSYLVWHTVRLAFGGKEAAASVASYDPSSCRKGKRRRGICHYHVLYADDHRFRLELDEEHSIGDQFYITYLPREPSVVQLGRKGSAIGYIAKHVGLVDGVFFFIAAIFLWVAFDHYRDKDSEEPV